ncbi:hypothetical protein Bint_1114 [Brachyspira intermedia PWS/A]|uniref:Uncharacterized protein n=1 Tax=Brachyspira intermedia (strain ATCC 51140 / PWS/A) TaxID=1045858 RepID=G0EMP9_BRAIP|nr:hypothetical protein [Brachyspira intermedia]AEM21737.1 hypothetical protein Bint_1114 [Brachyspira intermedia PWS/A]
MQKFYALSILFLMLFVSSLSANVNDYKNYRISIRPFNFDPNYDTYIEEIIESVLTDNGLNVFNRDKNIDKMMLEEQENIKINNPDAQSINKSLITHVVSGNIMKLEDKYICSISIKNINTYEPEKSVTKVLNDLSYNNIVKLSLDLYEKITGQQSHIRVETHQVLHNYKIQNTIPTKKISRIPAMVTGVLFIASGLAGTIYSSVELDSWHREIGGSAANEYYLYKNPNSSLSGVIQYRKLTLYNAWKKGEINTKPDNMPYFTPVGSSIILGTSIAFTIIGLGLFGWSLSDQPYFASNFDIKPTIFDENGCFDLGLQATFICKL